MSARDRRVKNIARTAKDHVFHLREWARDQELNLTRDDFEPVNDAEPGEMTAPTWAVIEFLRQYEENQARANATAESQMPLSPTGRI